MGPAAVPPTKRSHSTHGQLRTVLMASEQSRHVVDAWSSVSITKSIGRADWGKRMTASRRNGSEVVPRRRLRDLVVRDVGDDCLVYDLTSDEVALLDEATAAVWRRCDGSSLRAVVESDLGISGDEFDGALGRVAEAGLLEVDGVSRRALITRAAAVGALTSLATIAAPTPAMAASGQAQIVGTVTLLRTACTRGTSNAVGSLVTFTVRLRNWAPSTAYRVVISYPPLPTGTTLTASTTRTVTVNAAGQASPSVSVRVPRSNLLNPTPYRIEVFLPGTPPTLLSTTNTTLTSC